VCEELSSPWLSVIMPVLNEEPILGTCLAALQPLRGRGCEVLLCDGGSTDDSVARGAGLADRILEASKGRARQMNAGADAARGEVLLFLHADTLLPEGADGLVRRALERRELRWGRFDVRLSGEHRLLRAIEALMNLRSRWTGIATGDQALFVTRRTFMASGGFPDIPIMEDIEMSRRLKRFSPPACLRERVLTSSRRWEEQGILRTVGLMWSLRAAYYFGVSPAALAGWYRS
jgi:rSAM/selenodomain-associated transferase 2